MGIKFDILSEMFLLNEASDFTKFFHGSEPIELIHKELRVSHDTKLVLVPSENRHDLWVELRNGKAIFGVINDKTDYINKSYENLLTTLQKLSPPPNRKATYNMLRDSIQRLGKMAMVKEPALSSKDRTHIRNKIQGWTQSMGEGGEQWRHKLQRNKGLIDIVNELFPGDESLKLAFNEFLTALKPGDRILVKRIPTNYGPKGAMWNRKHKVPGNVGDARFGGPSNRYFRTPTPGTSEKVFGQEYVAWTFNNDKLVSKQHYDINAIKVYNPLFDGWGDRDMYVVEDEKFLGRAHPFDPSAPAQSADELRERLTGLEAELNVLQTKPESEQINRQIQQKNTEIANTRNQIKRLDSKMSIGFVEIIPLERVSIEKFATSAFTKYEKLLMDKIRQNTEAVKQKIVVDAEDANIPGNEKNVYIQQYHSALKIIEKGISQIDSVRVFSSFVQKDFNLNLADYTIISAKEPFDVFDPYKVDQNIQQTRTEWNVGNTDNNIAHAKNELGMGDDVTNKFKHNKPEGVAIAFSNLIKYNDFVRKFTMYAMRTVVKAPEVVQLERILAAL